MLRFVSVNGCRSIFPNASSIWQKVAINKTHTYILNRLKFSEIYMQIATAYSVRDILDASLLKLGADGLVWLRGKPPCLPRSQ